MASDVPAVRTGRSGRFVILLIFVLSGAAGLIDEIVWSRQLVLVFGNTTQAVSAILTGFFGGMAIGAVVGGRLADRVRSPLRLYGRLELVLAVVVVATPVTFRLINELYRGIYPALEDAPQALALVRMALAVLALAPATVLMGATLPTLTRHLTRDGHLSAAFGRLYAANTIGAIIGTLAAGLVLIELLGLTGALAVGAGCSAVAGLAALALARRADRSSALAPAALTSTPAASTPASDVDSPWRRRPSLALTVAFVSGFTTLGYQVLWTRMLSSGTGNTTYVFTVILMEFLIGLAIGALLFNILRQRMRSPARLLAVTQVLAGALVLVGLIAFIGRPYDIDPLRPLASVAVLLVMAIPVVLLTTIVLGLSFPSASALLSDDQATTGSSTGTFLSVNTLGSISGSFLVPFLLIPTLGSPHAAALLALVNVALGIGIAATGSGLAPARRLTTALGVALAFVIAAVSLAPGALPSTNVARLRSVGTTVYAATEDEIATVEAGEEAGTPRLWVAGTSMTVPTVDVKLMPILPLIARPASTDALVVAFGMGSSFRSAIIAGMRTDAAELVPSVPAMFGFYYPDAASILADPDARVIIADGRNHLELTDKRYDIIITDPPPPVQSSGASVISSREYYEVSRRHLRPAGIVLQWLPFNVSIDEIMTHIRTFDSVFPEVTIAFGPAGYGMYMLGSDQPIAFDRDAIRAVLERPGVLDDLSSAYDSPEQTIDGWTRQIDDATWLTGPAVMAFVGEGPTVTDDRPVSEYFLVRTFGGDDSGVAGPATLRGAARAMGQ
jgi:spermidine synthase